MNRKVKKAVFPDAGFGTRFLLATKAMPKELLPIVDKPLIQYVVEEAIAAEIDTLIFLTGRNKRAIEDYFDVNKELELALRSKGKNDRADMVRNIIPLNVECIFVRQAEQLGLGHAVLCAERAVAGEPFAVLLADDFLTDYASGVTADLVGAFEKTGNSQLSIMQVDEAYISQYGVIIPSPDSNVVIGVVEKPRQDEAPSNLASIGRYILASDIFDSLRTLPVGSGGEIQLADALNLHAQDGLLEAIELNGKRFDCGSDDGFMGASASASASVSAYEYAKRLEN
jgi:UTP--glucose-1-phosphate uridylyltransferase